MAHQRYLTQDILAALPKRMAFVGGPRQVGKTTLTRELLNKKSVSYLNWDIQKNREAIKRSEVSSIDPFVIYDEIHKYTKWRQFLKGQFDAKAGSQSIVVTGSARLDYYRKGGDSLFGRYQYFRLHPFSLLELNSKPTQSDLMHLLKFGGFPEPLLKGSEKTLRLWQRERTQRVLTEDLRDLENVKDVGLLELLADALPQKIGSPLSLQSLREDLEVSHDAIKRWVQIFENLYFSFRLSPFGSPKIRAVKKEQKLYLWDWSVITDPGARFENLVASQLLKYCHYLEDTQGYKMELRYLKDTDNREVDFVLLKDSKPQFAVEAKLSDSAGVSPQLNYFRERTEIPIFYQVHTGIKDFGSAKSRTRVLPFYTLCQELKLP